MKKLLSVLLAISIIATPLVSRVGFAEETLSKETEKEQSWFQKFLNETKKAGNVGWLSTKEFISIPSKGVEWLYKLITEDPKFSISIVRDIFMTIFLVKFSITMSKNVNAALAQVAIATQAAIDKAELLTLVKATIEKLDRFALAQAAAEKIDISD